MQKIATGISTLFHPVFVPFIGFYFLLNSKFSFLLEDHKSILLQSIFIVSLAIPLASVFILKWTGMIQSVRIPNVQERRIPYYITFASYLFLAMFFKQISFIPLEYSVLFFSSAISIFILISLINTTKASAHMTCLGGITGALYTLSLFYNYPFFYPIIICFIISGFVGWSRLMLKAHTLEQLLLGFSIGFLAQFFGNFLFEHFVSLTSFS